MPMREGMKILLCSDGVWDQLPTARIAELLSLDGEPCTASRSIVLEAAEAGGERSDNATAVVIDVCRSEMPSRQQTPWISTL